MDEGPTPIEDEAVLRAVRSQAARVHRRAVVIALAAGAVALLLP